MGPYGNNKLTLRQVDKEGSFMHRGGLGTQVDLDEPLGVDSGGVPVALGLSR